MIQRKGTVVGTDAFFREIAVGDEIRDIEGRLYTIDQFGRAKPLDGGNAVPLRNVKEPSVVRNYAGPDLLEAAKTAVQKAKAAPAEPAEPAPDVEVKDGTITSNFDRCLKEAAPATPDPGTPSSEPSETTGKMSQSPDKPRARGHRPNKTGFIRLTNLGVPFGLKCVEVREILEGAGIEIVPSGRRKESAIRKDAGPAAQRALDEWAEMHTSPGCTMSADLEPCALGTSDPAKVFTKDDAWLILDDQDLADELRRRGYEVTAIKHVEL